MADPNRPVAGAGLPKTDDAVVAAGKVEPNVKLDGVLVVAAPNPKAGPACDCVFNPPPKSDDAVVVAAGCCCCPKAEDAAKLNPCPGLLLFPPNMLLVARRQ